MVRTRRQFFRRRGRGRESRAMRGRSGVMLLGFLILLFSLIVSLGFVMEGFFLCLNPLSSSIGI